MRETVFYSLVHHVFSSDKRERTGHALPGVEHSTVHRPELMRAVNCFPMANGEEGHTYFISQD